MHMWIFSGVLAIITAFMNVSWTAEGKESKWLMFASLSFTALTLCSFYQNDANWVLNRDWAALEDVTPFAARRLWVCTIASIAINSVSLLIRPERESAADKADGEQKD